MTPCGKPRNHGEELINASASCQPEIDLRFMARDPELSTPRRDAAQWAMDRIAASEARVEAAVRAGVEAAADECNKTAVEARQYGLPELAIGACKCRDDIRAIASDPAAMARIMGADK